MGFPRGQGRPRPLSGVRGHLHTALLEQGAVSRRCQLSKTTLGLEGRGDKRGNQQTSGNSESSFYIFGGH